MVFLRYLQSIIITLVCFSVVATAKNDSLPFNKYAFLTTHNSFAISEGHHSGLFSLVITNQDDKITQQLNHGIRALMLDTYDYKNDIWLCHASKGKCEDYTSFGPAREVFKEIEAFLSANKSEIVTLFLEDYVETPKGLTKVFNETGLMKYWFPVSKMPQNGQDWPLVRDMVASNQRLVVFTSKKSKQESEGIAYQWNYVVENHYGDEGMHSGKCSNRAESVPLNDKTKSLVLVNHFPSIPLKLRSSRDNSKGLIDMVQTCYGAAGNRWANFVAVDFYRKGEAFQAIDKINNGK
ncbi:MAP3K-like protein kinase [Citrus sinensis]|uniref:Phosphatidylinositol-specific phospholipase C X domain-containing protein n=2 Tax=Citrus TaxID=2706 RepID=A0A2H5NVV9_CITUN|nr:PI-PLC X domain-containing protein At5g67130-like [Citrus sinensis]KAH9707917.1 MAP3K-like protein kinase [Citrus sinensis]GAY44240.1 hypothetical protein CUMW_080700 [Citrus unshiu]